jgi:hypothetical protein
MVAGQVDERHNQLHSRWRRLAFALLGAGGALLVAATLAIGFVEPRLLTGPELLPPDESLVEALLPAAVLLVAGVGLLWLLRRVPDRIRRTAAGIDFQFTSFRSRIPARWAHAQPVSDSAIGAGGRWTGCEIRVVVPGEHRHRNYFVDPDIAAWLRLDLVSQ